jgi:hypothetical protein
MKNKYNYSQVAGVYCAEIGVEIPIMEVYLRAVFNNQPLDKYDAELKTIVTNSEFFPELTLPPQEE